MYVKKILNTTYQIIGCASILLATIYGALSLYTTQQPASSIMQKIITQFSPYPVQYEKIQFTWLGLKPGIRIKNFDLFNHSEPDLPYMTIAQVNIFWDLPDLIFNRNKKIDKIVLVGARFSLHTNDNVRYQLSGFSDIYFSLENTYAPLVVNKIQFKKSDILLSNNLNKILEFTQTDLNIDIEESTVAGNTTLLGEKPAYLRFNHSPVINNEIKHQWYFELFCEDAEPLLAWLPPQYHYHWQGKTDVQAWVEQWQNQYDFVVKTKVKGAEIARNKDHLYFQNIEGHIKGRYLSTDLKQVASQYEIYDAQFDVLGIGFARAGQKYFNSVDVKLNYREKQGQFSLLSQEAAIQQSNWFEKPLPYQSIAAQGVFSRDQNGVVVKTSGLNILLPDLEAIGDLSLTFVENKPVEIDMALLLEPFQVRAVSQYLPRKKLNVKLADWFDRALISGTAKNTKFGLKGALDKMPDYYFKTKLDNTDVQYHKDWPILNNANINLLLENQALQAKVMSGNVLTTPIQNTKINIKDIMQKPAVVEAEVNAVGRVEKLIDILQQSPLSQRIGQGLVPYLFHGDMDISFDLQLPLSSNHIDDIKVDGLLLCKQTDAYLYRQDIPVEAIEGQLRFTENKIFSEQLRAKIWGEETDFILQSQYNKKTDKKITTVQAQGQVDVPKALQHFSQKNIDLVHGATDYELDVKIVSDQEKWKSDFNITSDLIGVSMILPKNLGKTTTESTQFVLSGNVNSHQEAQCKLSLPNVNAALNFQTKKNQPRKFMGGNIYFGQEQKAQHRQDGQLIIDGELADFKLGEYVDLFKRHKLNEGRGNNKHITFAPKIDIGIGAIDLYGLKANNGRLEGRIDQEWDNWQFSLVSPEITGYFSVPRDDINRVVVLELDKLLIPNELVQNDNIQSSFDFSSWRFPLEVDIDYLQYKDKVMDNVVVKFEPIQYGYYIKQLSFWMKDTRFDAKGYWHDLTENGQVDLSGKVLTENISSTLDIVGLKKSLRKANGSVDFNLSWAGSPFKFRPEALNGEINFNFKDGSIEGVNPGFGRILSLVSIDNIQRRLNLDFSDVTKKGMTFDDLFGKVYLIDGSIYSDKVTLNSASARVEANFRTRFDSQHLNGHITVMPDFTGSLPIAATIASGNPAVGAAVWVMDKLLGPTLQEMNRQEYLLMGSWTDPIIKSNNVQMTDKGGGS
tara:strand:+ start:20877 stop:24434 length:3558 start_codon:yes stop_codon:yes gene_type:complete